MFMEVSLLIDEASSLPTSNFLYQPRCFVWPPKDYEKSFRKTSCSWQTCLPWWCCFTFDNFLRKLFHNPKGFFDRISPREYGLDIGPGWAISQFLLPEWWGKPAKWLQQTFNRNVKSSLGWGEESGVSIRLSHISVRRIPSDSTRRSILSLPSGWSMRCRTRFSFLKRSDPFYALWKILLSEPILHVNQAMFEKTVKTAESCGLILMEKPKISLSRSALFMANWKELASGPHFTYLPSIFCFTDQEAESWRQKAIYL